MNSEKWKDIKNYEGYYQVSNKGKVRGVARLINGGGSQNKRFIKEKVLKNHVKQNGYCQVRLTKDGISKDFLVHRLVAISFKGTIEGSPHVNHIDGNKQNNKLDNLEWCNTFENMQHAFDIGLVDNRGIKSPNNKYSEAQILLVKKLLQEGHSNVTISKMTGVNRTTVYRVKIGKQWSHLFQLIVGLII